MPRAPTPSRISTDRDFVRRVFIVVAVGALIAAVWALSDILLLLFGSVLLAIALHSIASPLQTHLQTGRPAGLALAGLLILAVVGATGFYLGPELAAQMRGLFSTLPTAANRLAGYLQIGSVADLLKEGTAASALGGLAARIIAWSTTAAGALASVLLVLCGGIYLAINPNLYRDGLVKLVPPSVQSNVEATLDDAGQALRRWLAGQVIAMLLVGVCSAIGLWLAGVPSAFALGLIAGLAEFVPIIGPIVAAIPAILIASTQDWQTVLLAIAVLVIIQQVESNLITPMLADRMVSIAPAVGLFAVVAMGVLFGPLGLLLGFPLAIVLDVAVRRLYVRDTLGERIEILGKPAKPS
ncbi:MAG TPA: AI-2E family transporter [Hyphomicrobiaceae bacterium]|nr:AI-2E family transporter [Hyphomicrobiaceae bacterium]